MYSPLPPERLTTAGRARAAVLALGRHAALSGEWAAWNWGLRESPGLPVEVVTSTAGVRSRRGIRVRAGAVLADADVVERAGIRCLSLAMTLLDLASRRDSDGLLDLIDLAHDLRVYDHGPVLDLLDRSRGRRGAARLAEVLESYAGTPDHFRSRGEKALYRLVMRGGLPKPAVNHFLLGYERDFFWDPERFVVEYDGWDGHKTRVHQEGDRVRDATLARNGVGYLRITGRRAHRDPAGVIDDIRGSLAQRSPPDQT